MPEYRLTERSELELEGIWAYLYLNASEQIADEQVSRIKDSFRLLVRNPEMGSSRANYEPGIRRHNVARTPFFVLYRLIDDGIEIVRVIHGSRNLSRVLE